LPVIAAQDGESFARARVQLSLMFQVLGAVDLNKSVPPRVSWAAATKLVQVVSELRRALPADQVEVRLHPESRATVSTRLREWQSCVADFESVMDAAVESGQLCVEASAHSVPALAVQPMPDVQECAMEQ
jgi:hypothetical protein